VKADILSTINTDDLARHCFAVLSQPECRRRHLIETVTLIDAKGQQEIILVVFDRLLPSAFPQPRSKKEA
jgi:hypothetical protein